MRCAGCLLSDPTNQSVVITTDYVVLTSYGVRVPFG
ncbi:hypothetical protein NONI108955_13165 [Nocardia ninae]